MIDAKKEGQKQPSLVEFKISTLFVFDHRKSLTLRTDNVFRTTELNLIFFAGV